VQPWSENRHSKTALVEFEGAAEAARAMVRGGRGCRAAAEGVCSGKLAVKQTVVASLLVTMASLPLPRGIG
jgi:hypothetical protein